MKITESGILFMASAVLFGIVLTGTVVAGDSGEGCKLQGTWIYGEQKGSGVSMSTYMGAGDNEGTEIGFGVDPGIAWIYPNSYSTEGFGVWKKTGPRQYAYTMHGYMVERIPPDNPENPSPAPVNKIRFIVVMGGVKTLTSCNTIEVNQKMEFFWPDGESTGVIMEGTATGHRLVVGQATPLPE